MKPIYRLPDHERRTVLVPFVGKTVTLVRNEHRRVGAGIAIPGRLVAVATMTSDRWASAVVFHLDTGRVWVIPTAHVESVEEGV